MAKKSAYNIPSQLEINLNKQAMLTERMLMLLPAYPMISKGFAEGLVYSQLVYLTKVLKGYEEKCVVKISYTKLQRHLPFYSRRWLIEIIGRLEAKTRNPHFPM
jgi:hypothetical protein